jgi:beta-xylosidase
MRNPSTLLVSIVSTVLLAGVSQKAFAQCQDNDGDGYCSVASGGDDCEDLMSQYKATAGGLCKEFLQPTYLQAPSLYVGDPRQIHDHSWFRDSTGKYHLFAHNTVVHTPGSIRHFESLDLTYLERAPRPIAIYATPEDWDRDALWAPHVITQGGTYYMYVTGANYGPDRVQGGHDDRYQIGLVTSQDLSTWTMVSNNPVFDCETTGPDGTVARWVDSTDPDYSHRCRDPFVMYDAAHGRWLLFATAYLDSGVTPGPHSEGVIVAQSSSITGPWNHLGYIKATKTLYAGDGTGGQLTPAEPRRAVAENPFVTYFNGRYYLFFKDFKDPECDAPGNIQSEIQYATSPTLDFDPSGSTNWIYQGPIPDPGVSAAEIIEHGGDTWLMSANVVNCYADTSQVDCPASCPSGDPPHYNELRLKRIVWDGLGRFTTRNLTRLSCRVPSASIHPLINDPCNDGVDQDCDPSTNGCGGGGHGEPTQSLIDDRRHPTSASR